VGQIYFGNLAGKWVRFESALTSLERKPSEDSKTPTKLCCRQQLKFLRRNFVLAAPLARRAQQGMFRALTLDHFS